MEKCFVIQPFDNGKFDKRFNDIFQPAILKAELEPYRIDKDLSVRIPIDEIEKGIVESTIAFAEITTDNPNVWYELGYAFACNKDVIMVCSEERTGKFPFDIQHRHIITYKTSSKSDFEILEETITGKINALRQKSKAVKTLQTSPVVETEGLKSHEIAILIILTENAFIKEESMSVYTLRTEMSKAGYTDIATSIGVRTLSNKGFISTFKEQDGWNNGDYPAAQLTDIGENWIMHNQDQLVFRKEVDHRGNQPLADDLPF